MTNQYSNLPSIVSCSLGVRDLWGYQLYIIGLDGNDRNRGFCRTFNNKVGIIHV